VTRIPLPRDQVRELEQLLNSLVLDIDLPLSRPALQALARHAARLQIALETHPFTTSDRKNHL
jgi:hypothetical protein